MEKDGGRGTIVFSGRRTMNLGDGRGTMIVVAGEGEGPQRHNQSERERHNQRTAMPSERHNDHGCGVS